MRCIINDFPKRDDHSMIWHDATVVSVVRTTRHEYRKRFERREHRMSPGLWFAT